MGTATKFTPSHDPRNKALNLKRIGWLYPIFRHSVRIGLKKAARSARWLAARPSGAHNSQFSRPVRRLVENSACSDGGDKKHQLIRQTGENRICPKRRLT